MYTWLAYKLSHPQSRNNRQDIGYRCTKQKPKKRAQRVLESVTTLIVYEVCHDVGRWVENGTCSLSSMAIGRVYQE